MRSTDGALELGFVRGILVRFCILEMRVLSKGIGLGRSVEVGG